MSYFVFKLVQKRSGKENSMGPPEFKLKRLRKEEHGLIQYGPTRRSIHFAPLQHEYAAWRSLMFDPHQQCAVYLLPVSLLG